MAHSAPSWCFVILRSARCLWNRAIPMVKHYDDNNEDDDSKQDGNDGYGLLN